MLTLASVDAAWGWAMPHARRIIATNSFGNVLIEVGDGAVWRIIPEELSCTRIAPDLASFDALNEEADFREDWEMTRLVEMAEKSCGVLQPDTVYHLVIPAVLGGQYTTDNIQRISLSELVSVSGDMARQIDNLPDGAQVAIKVVE
ncbi:DUF1851 domain-containing protein [Defluviimonas aestuarii]|uniref:T6SS immunity protein Tdi1 domain-containing protein n=1 Tax=Albidovulum aestuarii TaxID=1130726 RepID=UPI00249B58BC|nr:T6SS immunity protein Tdi1 domain-containing protein [Defluviimonas aestuarii]MDI3335238.1 DUF1851 domain-containing protein [Defluviimonas aestuarii]